MSLPTRAERLLIRNVVAFAAGPSVMLRLRALSEPGIANPNAPLAIRIGVVPSRPATFSEGAPAASFTPPASARRIAPPGPGQTSSWRLVSVRLA